ncbi:MAG TPA: PSD1 and planctomycete cytochrome C domain-containing protein [Verrucomicrobiae bacterium]|jgi:hypothetical protein
MSSWFCLGLVFSLAAAVARGAAPALDFNRDIQPILSDNCYPCHGPDEKERKAKLRLDTKEGAFRVQDGVAVIVPGKSARSDLYRRITTNDEDDHMPPAKSNRKLTAPQIESIRRWIDQGAAWAKHWAYETPRRPEVPKIKNEIDSFVLARLEREKLAPSPPAPKETLIRRVSLDLTGLPPTPEGVDAFLADKSADAYEKVVDRLLKSPRYGERMVWEWLDAARYADSNGYQGDPTRTMWPWRDWVIKALNENLPFDQFTVWQLAGDLLPNATLEQKLATGFNRNHMINGEGGNIPEEVRANYVLDRVDTTATVWLGLTLGCARCHDHKFDPFTQREYYQLYAYFNNLPESGNVDAYPMAKPVMAMPTPEQSAKVAQLEREQEALRVEREELDTKLKAALPEWERSRTTNLAEWVTLEPETYKSTGGATITNAGDGALLVSGKNPNKDDFVITTRTRLKGITAFRLEALPDPSFTNSGPGRADNGNYVLSEFKVKAGDTTVPLRNGKGDFIQGTLSAAGALDGKPDTGWAIMPQFGVRHVATFETRTPLGDGSETRLTIRLEHQSGNKQHALGKFRLSATTDDSATLWPVPEKMANILALAPADRSKEQAQALEEHYLANSREKVLWQERLDELNKSIKDVNDAMLKTMVMEEREKPRDSFILLRGAYDKYGDKVQPGTPAALPSLPKNAPPNRLALAQWLVSPEHPLTARVTVNRYWQLFFGTGLVKTVEDFGVQGEKPSHPELLDWLATEFIRTGWDVKRMHRLIVTSAAYRQSSSVKSLNRLSVESVEPSGATSRFNASTLQPFNLPNLLNLDPENRLLARGPRFRMPSWMLRDQALFVSGLLVEQIGGKPVKPYQPPGVWEDATFGQITYKPDKGESLYRRSLYTFWRRIVGPTMFFDSASRQTCTVRQPRTNTPLHALATLNDITYVEAARKLAERVLLHGGRTDAERLDYAFQLCTGHKLSAKQKEVLLGSLGKLRTHYSADKEAAKMLVSVGESKRDESLDVVELAAYAGVSSLLLNLDETITKE